VRHGYHGRPPAPPGTRPAALQWPHRGRARPHSDGVAGVAGVAPRRAHIARATGDALAAHRWRPGDALGAPTARAAGGTRPAQSRWRHHWRGGRTPRWHGPRRGRASTCLTSLSVEAIESYRPLDNVVAHRGRHKPHHPGQDLPRPVRARGPGGFEPTHPVRPERCSFNRPGRAELLTVRHPSPSPSRRTRTWYCRPDSASRSSRLCAPSHRPLPVRAHSEPLAHGARTRAAPLTWGCGSRVGPHSRNLTGASALYL
jgi:hypothetical protein